ncbi:hypothetical protein AVBRAN9334_01265 [Campylobacter sp. RM9334]|uniref:hypothetical protein n=1 Tax=unclassified Campylobacter TaxID=2593542 RepID=UPI001BD93063|nr:hypothetical protein [Campylobacter sp. 2018MI13]MBT0883361.1 hypothetical protein [Campylobacter sp. 2018MI13]MBZ8006781.1 hypothetical protein [Campylobacter sp. RM9334]
MRDNVFIIVGVVAFLVIIALVFYFIIKSSKNKENQILTQEKQEVVKKVNALDDLIKAAKSAKTPAALNKVVLAFLQSQSLENRTSLTTLSEDAKKKLGFISVVCANKCAEAKLIAFLNHELGKKYPSYKREIDLYENLGLARRRMK